MTEATDRAEELAKALTEGLGLNKESREHVRLHHHRVHREHGEAAGLADLAWGLRQVKWWACLNCSIKSANAPDPKKFEVKMMVEYTVCNKESATVKALSPEHARRLAFEEISLRDEYRDHGPDGNTISITEVE